MSKIGDANGGNDQVRLEEYWKVMDGRHARCEGYIDELVTVTRNTRNVTRSLYNSAIQESCLVAVDLVRRYAGS